MGLQSKQIDWSKWVDFANIGGETVMLKERNGTRTAKVPKKLYDKYCADLKVWNHGNNSSSYDTFAQELHDCVREKIGESGKISFYYGNGDFFEWGTW